MKFVYDDGGRLEAGFKGSTGDCVTRALAIATQQSYQTIYDLLNEHAQSERMTKRMKKRSNARTGVVTRRKWFEDYMTSIGWGWTPTMLIGQGCKVHLRDGELPMGRLMVNVSRHYTTVIDGVIHDTYDPSRDGTRCVYGYWSKI